MGTAPTLSVVIATIGRPTLLATFESLRQLGPADEILLITDGDHPQAFVMLDAAGLACSSQRIVHRPRANDWGHTLRNIYSRRANGQRVLHIDDDDVYLDGALDLVRLECSKYPGQLVVFGILLPGGQIPRDHQIRVGNIDTKCGALPNVPEKWGTWQRFYGGDGAFYESCRFEVAWCDRPIAAQRPHEWDSPPGARKFLLHPMSPAWPGGTGMKMLIATATLSRHDLLNALYRPLARGLRGGDRLLVLDNGGQPIALSGSAVEIVRSGQNPGVPASWNYFLRRAFVEEDYDALMILGDDVRIGPAQVAVAKALLERHGDVDLLLSYSFFDVQVHRRGNERTIGFYDERFSPAWCEDDDYARTMIERGRIYQRFRELDPLPGSVRSGTEKPEKPERGRRMFAAKWPDDPDFGVNNQSAPHYRTNRYVCCKSTR
jgi:hypothetical protein